MKNLFRRRRFGSGFLVIIAAVLPLVLAACNTGGTSGY